MIIRRDILQRTDAWLEVKRGKVSGTSMKPILNSRSKTPWKTLIYDLIAQDEYDGALVYDEGYLSKAVQWGRDMEPFVIQEVENRYGIYIEEVGWLESTDRRFKGRLGCSPDGFVDVRENWEFKCLNTANHIKCISTGSIPTEYDAQVLNYFLVNGRLRELNFACFDPRVRSEANRLWIKSFKRKDLRSQIRVAKEKLVDFFELKKEIEKSYYGVS